MNKILQLLKLFGEELATAFVLLFMVCATAYAILGWVDSSYQDNIDIAIEHQAYLADKQAKQPYIAPADQVIIEMKND